MLGLLPAEPPESWEEAASWEFLFVSGSGLRPSILLCKVAMGLRSL